MGEIPQQDSQEPAPSTRGAGSPVFPLWVRLAPFVLSASFYVSVFLAILAPLPMVWLNLALGRRWALIATLTNGAVVWLALGPGGLAGYAVFSLGAAWIMPEAARVLSGRRKGAQSRLFGVLWSGVLSLLVVGLIGFLAWCASDHVSPAAQLQRAFAWLGEELSKQAPPGQWDPADWADQKEEWLRNLPSSVGLAALLQSWVVLTLMIRLNPGRIRERIGVPVGYLRGWRTPEPFVWPTIAAGFAWVVLPGWASDLGWNILKFCLGVYALQGLAILSCLFDFWRLRGFARGLGFFLVLSVMLPLLLGLGFFDLWFDFRSKLRHS